MPFYTDVVNSRTLAFFITGHGYGHGVRQAALINALPTTIHPLIFTSLPETFFREELGREFRYFNLEIDCGCIQPDSVHIDIEATLETYARIDESREQLIPQVAKTLVDENVSAVVGDIPPLAFAIAAYAKLPSLAISNFNWADIYRPFVAARPEFKDLLARIESDYALAGKHGRLLPGVPSQVFRDEVEVGLLSRRGRNRRDELAKRHGLDAGKRWCLVYMGSFGMPGVKWENLSRFHNWEFLGVYPLEGAPGNYHRVPISPDCNYADWTASCDVVLGKLGYGLVAECLHLGKGILFMGRRDFVEFDYLKTLLESRGQGKEVPFADLASLEIFTELEAMASRVFPTQPSEAGMWVGALVAGMLGE